MTEKEMTLEEKLIKLINYMQEEDIKYFGTEWDYAAIKNGYSNMYEVKQYLGYVKDIYEALNMYLEKNFVPNVSSFPEICLEYDNQRYFLHDTFNNDKYSFSFFRLYSSEKDVSQLLRLSILGNEVKTAFVTDEIAADSKNYIKNKINEMVIHNSIYGIINLFKNVFSQEEVIQMIEKALVDFKGNEQEEKSSQKIKKI